MSKLVVAIDGPAASGKSSVAKKSAMLLGCTHVDSGSLYRGLTWHIIRKSGVREIELSAVPEIISSVKIDFYLEGSAVQFKLNGLNPADELRSELVQKHVSKIAAIPKVRIWALGLLRGLICFGDLVVEGRDIGTVVFPHTPFKFYLEADASERARRRHLEALDQKNNSRLEAVQQSLLERDMIDSKRNVAPLRKASGAHIIDTTLMTIDQVVAMIVNVVLKEN